MMNEVKNLAEGDFTDKLRNTFLQLSKHNQIERTYAWE